MAKKITIEGLARAIADLTEAVGTRFDRVDTAIKETRTELGKTKVELEEHIRDLGSDITRMERKIDGIPSLSDFNDLRKRLERVEKKVGIA